MTKLGDRGEDVIEVQRLLGVHGAAVTVDGDFGPQTEAAARAFQRLHRLVEDGIVGPVTLAELRKPAPETPRHVPSARGLVVPLTDEQRVTRALFLAGKVPLSALDVYVARNSVLAAYGYDSEAALCLDLEYMLRGHNGGKDPTAPDPGDRWTLPGDRRVRRTADCSGANAWMDGVDRYQPKRMAAAVGYDGWFNTDSKIIDARRTLIPGSGPRCYEDIGRPEPGAIIVCRSGSPGHAIGHEGRVTGYRGAEWDPRDRACWKLIDVVDCAARRGRANLMTTGAGWYGTGAMFLRCVMAP